MLGKILPIKSGEFFLKIQQFGGLSSDFNRTMQNSFEKWFGFCFFLLCKTAYMVRNKTNAFIVIMCTSYLFRHWAFVQLFKGANTALASGKTLNNAQIC